jgi:hypothetical protein
MILDLPKHLLFCTPGASQNWSTKTFFLGREPKHQSKLASPIRDENEVEGSRPK